VRSRFALRKENQPSNDAVLVRRLREAGAILLGNTNTPEFLMAYETDNRLSGQTSNPWSTEYSSGGSSGGRGCCDCFWLFGGRRRQRRGGSIRVPAHFCGICGLKPTPGRIPSTGHYPAGNSAFGWLGVVGPMARTVGDLKICSRSCTDQMQAMRCRLPFKFLKVRAPHRENCA